MCNEHDGPLAKRPPPVHRCRSRALVCMILAALPALVPAGAGAEAADARARSLPAAQRCTGSWLVAAGQCFASAPRTDCGVLSPAIIEARALQDRWPLMVGPFVASGMTCAQVVQAGPKAANKQTNATEICKTKSSEIVTKVFGDGVAVADCGAALLLPNYCADNPQTGEGKFFLVFEVSVYVKVKRENSELTAYGAMIFGGQRLVREAEYASCSHPGNGEAQLASCLADGDGMLTGPGLTLAEALSSSLMDPNSTAAVAICLSGDAPGHGIGTGPGESKAAPQLFDRLAVAAPQLDEPNLAR